MESTTFPGRALTLSLSELLAEAMLTPGAFFSQRTPHLDLPPLDGCIRHCDARRRSHRRPFSPPQIGGGPAQLQDARGPRGDERGHPELLWGTAVRPDEGGPQVRHTGQVLATVRVARQAVRPASRLHDGRQDGREEGPEDGRRCHHPGHAGLPVPVRRQGVEEPSPGTRFGVELARHPRHAALVRRDRQGEFRRATPANRTARRSAY